MKRARDRRSAAIRTGRRSSRWRSWTGSASRSRSTRWRSLACSSVDPAAAKALARRCNDYAAELNARWPKRFGAFAHGVDVATSTTRSTRSPTRSIHLKFSGVSLFASYDGKFLGDPLFDPVMAALNERDAVVFVHPGTHPLNKHARSAVAGLHDGIPVRHHARRGESRVRRRAGAVSAHPFILPHAGGLVPYFSWRLSVSPMIDARLKQMSQEQVFELLQAVLVRQRALARRADLGMPGTGRIAGPDRVRQRLAVRQRARHRRGGQDLRSARRDLAGAARVPSIAAMRCGCSRSSPSNTQENAVTRP